MNAIAWIVIVGIGLMLHSSQSRAIAPPDFESNIDYIPESIESVPAFDMTNNVAAFLQMIRIAETGMNNDSAYTIYYGGSSFTDMSDHPVITGEKMPVVLSESICKNAGYASGHCFSTAAGAYQFNRSTWSQFRADLRDGFGALSSFSPAYQDIAATRVLAYDGAIPYIEAGDFLSALQIASTRWASLPYSEAGQHRHSIENVTAWYVDSGGIVV